MAMIAQQPARIPLVDPQTGLITREWMRYFQALYVRSGGAAGASSDDLSASAGISEQAALIASSSDAAGQAPAAITSAAEQDASGDLAALRAQVADLQQQVNDIKQGLMA